MEKDIADQQEPYTERQNGSETTWPVLGSAKKRGGLEMCWDHIINWEPKLCCGISGGVT